MKRKIVAIALTVLISLAILAISYALIAPHVIKNEGRILTINVDTDTDLIKWGIVAPNTTETYTINVRVQGNAPSNLTIYTTNWNPINTSLFMELTWNYTGEILMPDVWIPIELSLHVSPDISGIDHFSFYVTIVARGET